jgi:hypothetical protein
MGSLVAPSQYVTHAPQIVRIPLGLASAVTTACFLQTARAQTAHDVTQSTQAWCPPSSQRARCDVQWVRPQAKQSSASAEHIGAPSIAQPEKPWLRQKY